MAMTEIRFEIPRYRRHWWQFWLPRRPKLVYDYQPKGGWPPETQF